LKNKSCPGILYLYRNLPTLFYFFFEFFNDIAQAFVPIQVRAEGVATAGQLNALGMLPNLATTRTAGACRKRIPNSAAGALPVRFAIRLPFALRATNMYIIKRHGIKDLNKNDQPDLTVVIYFLIPDLFS
jgi:hypothetical protein